MTLDNYTSAVISMTGMIFDSVGGLYLAYDLLGGERGPLSKLTRCATYSLMAFLFFAFAFNLKFALILGIGMGSIFGLQLDVIGSGTKPTMLHKILFAVARMLVLFLASQTMVSQTAAIILGLGAFTASLASSKLKVSPEFWYEATKKPEFRWRRLAVGMLLGTMITLMAWVGDTISGAMAPMDSLSNALHMGFVVGIGTALIATISPFVEWYADNMPPKRMGYFGAIMFMIGFIIQAIPSLCVLLGS